MTDRTETANERDEVEMMLPWYVSGQLDAADKARVEAYLALDPDLEMQLQLIREEQDLTVEVNEAAGAPGPGALDRLMTSIEAEKTSPARGLSASVRIWLEGLVGGTLTPGVRWAGAAAAAIILVQAVTLGALVSSGPFTETRYEAASGEKASESAGTYALVKFTQGAKVSEISAFLSDQDMEIVEGPKAGGLYLLRLSEGALADAKRDELLKKLASQQMLIEFAEPAVRSGN